MAEKKNVAAEEKESAPKFPIQKLRDNCLNLFGITTSTFDGAVYGLTGSFSVQEMSDKIKQWQSRPVLPTTKKEVN